MFSTKQLKTIIKCEVDTSTAVSQINPVKIEETPEFDRVIDTAVSNLKNNLTDTEFAKLDKFITEGLREHGPKTEPFVSATSNEQPEPDKIKNFSLRLKLFLEETIKENLVNAFIELYIFTNTLPSVGQVFNIYEYQRFLKGLFQEHKALHELLPGSNFYLEECIFQECSCFDKTEAGASYGGFSLKFCRYDKGDIVF